MNEIKKRYEELYEVMATSKDPTKMRTFGEAEKWAFRKVAERDPSMAQMWLDKLEPVMWKNYLSKVEAEAIVSKFVNADGTIGAHWSYDTMRSAVESLGAVMSEEPFFNCWALWATMNMLYSDHAKSVNDFVPKEEQVKFYYAQAIEKLKDADRPHFVREYFEIE